MNMEKWIIAHFSPTGGTKKVADAIAPVSMALDRAEKEEKIRFLMDMSYELTK